MTIPTTSPAPVNLPERMQAKIQLEISPVAGLPGFCWAWTGALTSRGYGCVGIEGKRYLTHRATYQLLVGPIEDGLELDHLCENKVCCNPQHTEPVTGVVNTRRARAHTFYCAQGHPLAGRNVVTRTRAHDGYERRICRICQYEWQRQRYQRANPHARHRSFAAKRDAILADARRALAEQLAKASA